MKLFTPPGAPSWLDPLLRRIRQGLGEPWDSPLRLQSIATASLPTAADYPAGLIYDSTTAGVKFSNGTVWAAVGGSGGVSDGDKGDVTVTVGGTVWTIDNGVVSLAKMADVATGTVFYRKTAGTGAPEVQTLATLKTDLGLTGTNSGDQTSIVGITGTLAQFDTACTDANFLSVAAAAAAYQPLDGQLTDLAGLAYASNALKVVRVNAGETGFELAAAGGGSGDVVGPASATNNAIARYDATTGKLLQDSAATVSDDGIIRSATNSGANAVAVPLVNWVHLTADYTLTSTTSLQKLFNTTANGTLTLPSGVYRFFCKVRIDTMSGTSGNGSFDFLGAGTAVIDRITQGAHGKDGSISTIGAYTGQTLAASATANPLATAATSTQFSLEAEGLFRVSTGGTIIPSFALATAAAAVVKTGSYFTIEKIGESTETYLGAWT